MDKLSANWFIEGLIDFEYKKYILLAYLKNVDKHFVKSKLYPHLSELVTHYRNLQNFIDNKKKYYDNFPKELSSIDFQNFKLAYRKVMDDDDLMQQIEDIVDFSLPKIKSFMKEGKELFEFIESKIEMIPVGLISLNNEEGYMFIRIGSEKRTNVYRYRITFFENSVEKYRAIKTSFMTSFKYSISLTYEEIKKVLIKDDKTLSNPATYAFETGLKIPINETMLPIAKRMLVRNFAA